MKDNPQTDISQKAPISDVSEAMQDNAEAICADCAVTDDAVIAPPADCKPKRNVPPFLKKLQNFFAAHEQIRQIVFFIGFSLICFAVEYIVFTVLSVCLKKTNTPINWFVFKYPASAGGVGAFVAFLVSNVIAQICTFVLNRKKTFRATNNIVISGIMYAVLVICIILLNTYLGGVITDAISKAGNNSDAYVTLGGYVGKFIGSLLSFVINFVGCKFLVMRNWGKSCEHTPVAIDAEDADVAEAE